ncbi:MAG TPA: nitronate monooxygenase [Acidobacteria bacterium]|nr:nitronate monooxygenase [Acidobacteriota bacterium]
MAQRIKTRVTDLLGIEHPIIQGGMMWVSQPGLVAAVSNAGALGVLTALTFGDPEGLARAIDETRRLTDRPFGVNLTFLPTLKAPDYGGFIDVIVDKKIPVVETAGRNPEPYLEAIKAGGAVVIHKCTAVRFAKKAEAIGCDAVSIDGFECAGHPGEDDVTSLILIPRTVDELSIPVIASGGFGDGRGLAAALALGAGAINMGTRFVATAEAPVHDEIKQALVRATETNTTLVMRTLRNSERVLRNAWAEKVLEREAEGATLPELIPLLKGEHGLKALRDGEPDVGLLAAGQVVGLIDDVPPVAELIERIVGEAATIIGKRLPGLLV